MKYVHVFLLVFCWSSLFFVSLNASQKGSPNIGPRRESTVKVDDLSDLELGGMGIGRKTPPLSPRTLAQVSVPMHPKSHAAIAQRMMAVTGFQVSDAIIVKHLDGLIVNKEKYAALCVSLDNADAATTRRRKNKKPRQLQAPAMQQPIVAASSSSLPPQQINVIIKKEEKKDDSSDSDDDDQPTKQLLKAISSAVKDELDGNKAKARKDCHKIVGASVAAGISLAFNIAQNYWGK